MINSGLISALGIFPRLMLALVLIGLFSPASAQDTGGPIPVEVSQNDNGNWQLLRDGKPYRIRGAGGEGSLKLLAECGGNSNRTWGVGPKTRQQLDEAHKNGISVAFGIWLQHKSDAFDYANPAHIAKQKQMVLEVVREFKNHPAILVWGLGNEMEGYEDGDDPNVWKHIEDLCQAVKKEDPNHPTMSVIAELGPQSKKVIAIHKHCPSLDIIGINSYGIVRSVRGRYRAAEGNKPYVITEFGPVGQWEVEKNEFEAINEPTSTEKAEQYSRNYQRIVQDKGMCLGCYAFLWGNKMEATETWFGMLLPDGKKTSTVDAMTKAWTGKDPANRCPVIESFELTGENVVKPGTTVVCNLKATDPDGHMLNVKWKMTPEAERYITYGQFQETPAALTDALVDSTSRGAKFKMPGKLGLYRIYAVIDDGNNAAATASVVIKVGSSGKMKKTIDLPFVVYDEADQPQPYSASGWMGSADSMKLEPDCNENPKSGKTCMKFEFNRGDNWGGIVWQNPENDWGDLPGGFDLTGATKLTFWARGNAGNESVKFGVGLLETDKEYYDTTKRERQLTLTKEWKQYSIDLKDADLSRIKSAFWFSLPGQGAPVRFYMDRIAFE